MKLEFNMDLFWKLGLGLVEIGVAYLLGNFIDRMILKLTKSTQRKGAFTFLASFTNIAIKVVGVIIALDQIGVSMNIIVSALTALGLGVSLALKDNMAAVASGLQILLTKPFQVGDYVKVGKHDGIVKAIEMTYTILETRNDDTVIINNNKMITKTLINYSNVPDRRIVIQYPCLKKNVREREDLLLRAAKLSKLVVKEPLPKVVISSIHEDNVTLELYCYCKAQDYWQANDEIMSNIYRLDKDFSPAQQAEDLQESPSVMKKEKEALKKEMKNGQL